MSQTPRPPIYMDHHATTPVLPEVVRAMLPYLSDQFGNPSSSAHWYGRAASEAVEEARTCVAHMVNAEYISEIIFTAGATESDNLALRGLALAPGRRGDHILTCAIEHEAVLETCNDLERAGYRVTILPVDEHGLVDPDDVRRSIRDSTFVVSIMMANNEIGTIQPLEAIGRICRQQGVLLHTDAVQAAGRIPVDVRRLGVDLMSLTAHKMYGPKGVGALYVRRGITLAPMMAGGGQEGGLRSGTLNVPGIAGFGRACLAAVRDMADEAARQAALRDRLWKRLSSRVARITLNGHPSQRLPNNLNVSFDGVEAEATLTAMRDVAALSSGSACASGSEEGSYVVRALSGGASGRQRARSSIRFGLGRSNDESQVDEVAERIAKSVERLRAMAPRRSRVAGPARSRTDVL